MRWLAFVLFAGCTAANPHFGQDDLGHDGSSSTVDASLSDGASAADAAVGNMCSDGPRNCSAAGSQVCEDGVYSPDRDCPQGSSCANGYCQPPANAKSCSVANQTSDALCSITMGGGGGMGGGNAGGNTACQPFVGGSSVVWDCAAPVGSGTAGQSCTAGTECRSGICADHLCFRACATANDCPKVQGNAMQCAALSVVVEGVTISTHGCIPQG